MSDIGDFSVIVLFKRPSNVPKSTMVKKSKSLLRALTVVLVDHIKMWAEIDQSRWPIVRYFGWANNYLKQSLFARPFVRIGYLTQDKVFIR